MKDAMDCGRAEELLSDHHEGTLAEPLLSELETHLASCAGCRGLRETMAEVISALGAYPGLDPPLGLAERAADAALARPLAVAARKRVWVFTGVPAGLQAAAAALALAVTGLVLLAAGSSGPSRTAARFKERTVNAGAYVMERKERLAEDFRILRVVIGTAFGSRLDRVNDRVDDYRRLLERQRAAQPEPKKTNGGPIADPAVRAVDGAPHSLEHHGSGARNL